MAAINSVPYRVVITREDGHWLAEVPSLQGAHTYARSLSALDQAVREVMVLAADLPDESMPGLVLEYEYHTGDARLDKGWMSAGGRSRRTKLRAPGSGTGDR